MTEEIWKPVQRFGKIIPGYYVSNLGRIMGRRGKIYIGRQSKKLARKNDKTARLTFDFRVPHGFYPNYVYRNPVGEKNVVITVAVHRLVMDAFKPLDEYPPIPKEDWGKTPESAKNFIRDTVVIDHINDDPFDNRVENLRWVSSLQNSNYRKKYETINFEKHKINSEKTLLERFLV